MQIKSPEPRLCSFVSAQFETSLLDPPMTIIFILLPSIALLKILQTQGELWP